MKSMSWTGYFSLMCECEKLPFSFFPTIDVCQSDSTNHNIHSIGGKIGLDTNQSVFCRIPTLHRVGTQDIKVTGEQGDIFTSQKKGKYVSGESWIIAIHQSDISRKVDRIDLS